MLFSNIILQDDETFKKICFCLLVILSLTPLREMSLDQSQRNSTAYPLSAKALKELLLTYKKLQLNMSMPFSKN